LSDNNASKGKERRDTMSSDHTLLNSRQNQAATAVGTDRTHKLRAIFFSLLMLLSVVAGSIGAIGIEGAAAAPTNVGGENPDWPMFRDDSRNTGVNSAPGVDAPVKERWRFETFDGDVYSPAVVDGTVYFGSDDDRVYALDAQNGTEQWSFFAGANVRSSPAVVNGTVYIGSGDFSSTTDGTVYALDAQNGTQLWNFTTSIDGGVESSPVVANGTVYVGGRDGDLYALDAQNGSKLWSENLGSAVLSSPAVANGTVYVGSDDNNVYALDVNGTQLWSSPTDDSIKYSSPAVVNGTVYIGSNDNHVYALDAQNGAEQWNFTTGGDIWSGGGQRNRLYRQWRGER